MLAGALEKQLFVVKSDGTLEEYDPNKIAISCMRCGVPYDKITEVTDEVSKYVQDGISTADIRKLVFTKLKEDFPEAASLYKKEGEFYVRTTSNQIERWNRQRIADSLTKEANVDLKTANGLAKDVEKQIQRVALDFVSAPLVREMVNVKLLERGLEEERAAYTRLGLPVYDVGELIQSKRGRAEYEPASIASHAGEAVLEQYLLLKSLPRHLTDPHFRGMYEICGESYFPTSPYSIQHDLRYFLERGVVCGQGVHSSAAKAPRKASVAILHAARLLRSGKRNVGGWQSFDHFNVFMAPYLRGLDEKRIKQLAQTFVFEVDQEGGLCNLNLEFEVPPYLQGIPAGKGTYGDYGEEAKKLLGALIDVYMEGDAYGKPHFFPSLTFKLRKTSGDLVFKAHELVAKFGTGQFVNLTQKWQGENANYAGTNRLSSTWKSWEKGTQRTGNLHPVALNLPRLGYETNGDDSLLYNLLDERLEMLRDILIAKDELMRELLRKDRLLAFLAQDDSYYRPDNALHAIGIVGLNELLKVHCNSFLSEDQDAWKFGIALVKYMDRRLSEFGKETGMRWAIQQAASSRLAEIDRREFGFENIVAQGSKEHPYYTHSTHVPSSENLSIGEKVRIEEPFHALTEGGHVLHLNLEKPSAGALMGMTEKLCKDTAIGSFIYSQNLTHCSVCQQVLSGLAPRCPNCGCTNLNLFAHDHEYYNLLSRMSPSDQQMAKSRHAYKL